MGSAGFYNLVIVLHDLVVKSSVGVADVDHILRNQQQSTLHAVHHPYSLLSKELTPLMKSAT